MKRFLGLVVWAAAGASILALTSTGPASAGIHPGTGTHRAQAHVIDSHIADRIHRINLHKAYEARLGTATLGKIAGKVPPFGTKPLRGRGGNNCAEPTCALQYNGGVVQHTPHVYLLLWGPNWATDPSQEATATYLENFYSGLGDQPQDNWSTVMDEYPDGSGPPTFSTGVYAGTWNDTSSPPTNGMLGQEGLAAEADAYTAKMGVKDVNDAQVIVATQSGTCPDGFAAPMCGQGNGDYCAWHSSSNEPYTNLPYILDAGTTCGQDSVKADGTNDGLSIVASHEYAATVTDPFPTSGWWDPADPNGGEITDKCVWDGHSSDVTLATGIFAMQPEWSNSAGGCVMHIGGNSDIVTMKNPVNQTTYQNSALSLTVEATSTDQLPLTWSATGLPAGLTIDPATGIITGRLTASPSLSPYSMIVKATDTTGAFAWAPFTWTVLADVGSPITNQASSTCLNDHGWSTTPGNLVLMWKCLQGPAEMFSQPTNSGELIVLGQCMSDPTGLHKGGAGALQELEPCTGATNQMWFHNAQNEYVLETNFMCLTDQGGSTTNGAPVAIEPCTGATDQIWSGPATAGISHGPGTHSPRVQTINLHKAYEAHLRHVRLGKIAGKFLPLGAKSPRGPAANDCVEPSCAIQYNGGPVQHTPHVYLLLWGPNWSTDPSQEATATYLENFYSGLGVAPDDNWSNVMAQYSGPSGPPTFTGPVLAGVWHDTSSPPTGGQLGQVGLAAEADAFTTQMGVTDLSDAQVVVATQSGTCPDGFAAPGCASGDGGYCAWHSSSMEPFINLPYVLDAGSICGQDSVNSNGTDDGLTIVAGHEYAETITDPSPTSGWWDPDDPSGGEIADKCAFSTFSRDVTLSTGSYAMQPLWSNDIGACVMHIGGASDNVKVTNPGNQSNYHSSALSLTVGGVSTKKHPLTWSATGLPAGLSIDPATGIISGKITAAASANPDQVIVSASDTTGAFGWAPFTWTVLADVGTPITNKGSSTCLNDHGSSVTPGNQVFMWQCLSGPAEMFSQPTNAGQLIVLGQCLTDPTGGTGGGGAGTLQVIEPCTSSANQNQVWLHNSKNEYVLEQNFMCLTNQGGATNNGAPLSIQPCTGVKGQIWSGS